MQCTGFVAMVTYVPNAKFQRGRVRSTIAVWLVIRAVAATDERDGVVVQCNLTQKHALIIACLTLILNKTFAKQTARIKLNPQVLHCVLSLKQLG